MVRLRPRARLIRTIGDQLVSGAEAAVIELVKNAYDADAKSVRIVITPGDSNDGFGRIAISDDGHGMTKSDVVKKWFEPATEEKVVNRTSASGRPRLGAKGIGRFAAARLGARLTVISSARLDNESLERVRFTVDWNRFNDSVYLEDIEIDVDAERIPLSQELETGVKLDISGLRDKWTEKRLRNLIRELRRLLLPSAAGGGFAIHLDIRSFRKENCGFDGEEVFRDANFTLLESDDSALETLVRPYFLNERADYRLVGEFDEAGGFRGTFCVLRGDGVEVPISIAAPAYELDEAPCGPLSVRLFVYDREPSAIEALFGRMGIEFSKIGLQGARRILNENAGIALYRDSFRIRPYGDPEFDWLELERGRVQDPSRRIGHSQVSGRIDLADSSASGLVERSSREGLEHSPSFERLKHLIGVLLRHVEMRRAEFRERAGIGRKPAAGVEKARAATSLRALRSAIARTPEPYKAKLEAAIDRDVGLLNAEFDAIEEFQILLESRAALGLVLNQVLHDGRRFLSPMLTSVRTLQSVSSDLLAPTRKGEVVRAQMPEHLSTLDLGLSGLAKLFKQLDPVSGRRRGRPTTFDAREMLDSSVSLLKDTLEDKRIQVELKVPQGLELYGYKEDLQAALLNILDNAIYWTAADSQGRITVEAVVERQAAIIRVSNTGPLVDEAYIGRLFEAGFTLKSNGSGLGLAIAREAVRRSRGDVWYDDASGYACFTVKFPRPHGA